MWDSLSHSERLAVFQKFKHKFSDKSQGKKELGDDFDHIPKENVLSMLEEKVND